jgi:hypothetical protein
MNPLITRLPDREASSRITSEKEKNPAGGTAPRMFSWSETPTQTEDDFFKLPDQPATIINAK